MTETYSVTQSTYVAFSTVGAAFLLYGALGRFLDRVSFSSATFFLIAGIVASPIGFGTIPTEAAGSLLRIYAEVTLAIVLCTESAKMDFRALRLGLITPARLITVALPASIVLGALLALMLFPNFAWLEAALLGVILAPTDADLARPVVANPDVPEDVTLAIEVESGLNDGICVPLLLTLGLLAVGQQTAQGVTSKLLHSLAEEIGIGTAVGVSVGLAFVVFANVTRGRYFVTGSWLLVPFVALALFSFAMAQSLGGSGFIAAFAAGVVVSFDGQKRRYKLIEASEGLANILSALTWISFGVFCFPMIRAGVTWPMIAYALLSLTVVRMVPVMTALITSQMPTSNRAFVAWFGPRGLASVAFLILLLDEGVIAIGGSIFQVTVLTVTASIVLHGFSAGPLAKLISQHTSEQKADIGA